MRYHLEPSGQSILKARPTFNSHRCSFRKTEASEGLSVGGKTSLPEQICRWPGARQSGGQGWWEWACPSPPAAPHWT